MVRTEELRAKLRMVEEKLHANPTELSTFSDVDVLMDNLNGDLISELNPVVSSSPDASNPALRPGVQQRDPIAAPQTVELPTEVEELQKMVMAYHRFMKHTIDNTEKEKKKAVQQAERRMKEKFLPMIAKLEKANVELKSQQNRRFRLF